MKEVRFFAKGYQVLVRYRKGAWYLSYFDKKENEGKLFRFPVEPDVSELIAYRKGKTDDELFDILMGLPHKEIK